MNYFTSRFPSTDNQLFHRFWNNEPWKRKNWANVGGQCKPTLCTYLVVYALFLENTDLQPIFAWIVISFHLKLSNTRKPGQVSQPPKKWAFSGAEQNDKLPQINYFSLLSGFILRIPFKPFKNFRPWLMSISRKVTWWCVLSQRCETALALADNFPASTPQVPAISSLHWDFKLRT